MITTTHYSDSRYRVQPGDGYDGVVRVNANGHYATGTLLFDGRAILTAAHLFDGHTDNSTVIVETPQGTRTLNSVEVLQHPGYDTQTNADLAIVWLSAMAPSTINRYSLYRDQDEIGQTFTAVGYGKLGTGNTGANVTNSGFLRLQVTNRFDEETSALKTQMGAAMSWSPQAGTQLLADFDDGLPIHDALGQLISSIDLGTGLSEGMIAEGDSGGPAFIQGQLAGVATYTTRLTLGPVSPDIDALSNSSFGEIGAWQRVSAFERWIDQSLRAHYPNAPTRPEDVKKQVPEGSFGTSYAFFLVQFTGVRLNPEQILSVDYATRDGSATAGSDYIAAAGTLKLYPDETQAVIPVEIIGDYSAEADENFYLDVFNPSGGSFGPGVVKLTAMRTITDDDSGWP